MLAFVLCEKGGGHQTLAESSFPQPFDPRTSNNTQRDTCQQHFNMSAMIKIRSPEEERPARDTCTRYRFQCIGLHPAVWARIVLSVLALAALLCVFLLSSLPKIEDYIEPVAAKLVNVTLPCTFVYQATCSSGHTVQLVVENACDDKSKHWREEEAVTCDANGTARFGSDMKPATFVVLWCFAWFAWLCLTCSYSRYDLLCLFNSASPEAESPEFVIRVQPYMIQHVK